MNNRFYLQMSACLASLFLLSGLSACTTVSTGQSKAASSQQLKETSTAQAEARAKVEFICADGYDQQTDSRLPTTYAWTERGKIAVVRWSTDFFERAGFSPQKRCELVSPRFQKAYDQRTLSYLTNGNMNGQSVICTATEPGGDCADLLLTLRPQDKPLVILEGLASIFRGRGTEPLRHISGQIYYPIDMQEFLRNAPVEEE